MPPPKKTGPGISALIREAGQKAASTQIIQATPDLLAEMSGDMPAPIRPRIFSIIDYIESDWGLGMRLFPVQRFIVKLYYHLPLNDRDKTIQITDMFNTRVLYRFTEVEYLHFLYSEGRCNLDAQDHERRELLLAIGRRGGKCCREGTYINTHNGFQEIQELGDVSGAEYQPLQIEVAQEGVRRSISAFFYNGGARDTIRVRSRCGYEIEGTSNHRVRVMAEDGTIQWRCLGEMRAGNRIGVHRKTDLWPEALVDTSSYLKGLPGRKAPNLPSVITEEWGTFLGVLVGDGSWTATSMLEVTVGPYPEWLEQVLHLFHTTLGDGYIYPEPKRPRVFRVRCHSSAARHFLDRLGYKIDVESHTKRVPWVIMRSPKSVVAAFLRGLFETDGGVESGGRKVSFCTASARLASEVQLLLLNFGIVSRVRPRLNKRYNKTFYHLTVLGADSVRIFAEQIGFISDRKASLLRAHIAKGDLGNKSGTEAIPYQKAWCGRLLESVPKNNGNASCAKLGWRRSLLRAALGNVLKNTTEDLSYPRLRAALVVAREVGADPQVITHFEGILAAGYFYDVVTEVSPSRGRVYDLTVPDGESFVANGMTNHNTTLSGIFASYEVYRLLNLVHPQGYYGLPPGNRIQIVSIATDKDQAGLLFNEVTSHLSRCEYFKPYIANNTLSYIQFRTPNDIEKYGGTVRHENGKFTSFNGKATLRVTFKSCIAKGLRGSGNIVVILDEMAHFKDEGGSSAKEIYDAVTPSTAAFSPKNPADTTQPIGPVESRIICISSPLNKTGKFYDLFHLAMGRGEGSNNMIAIQAPTWEINPTIEANYYKQKYHGDPAVFMTEHGAQFSDRVRGWIERESDLLACIDPEARPKDMGFPRYPHQMGIDLGLVGDGTSIFITHCEGDKIILDYHETWSAGVDWRVSNPHLDNRYPTDYARRLSDLIRLDFDAIAEWIISLTKRFFISDGIFDRWNGIPLEQAMVKAGLNQFKAEFFTRDFSSRIFQNAKLMMYDEKLVLYDHPVSPGPQSKHSPFIQELLTLQAEQVSKNIVAVAAPESGGCHDDMSDAFVRAVWLSSQRMVSGKHIMGAGGSRGASLGASPMTAGRYQMARARQHGGLGDRVVPRNLGMRFRGR